VSETFIRLWNARARVDLPTVKAYLLAIARNLVLHERRRLRRLTHLGGPGVPHGAGLTAVGLPATPPLEPAAEKQALDATRQLLKARTSTLVVAAVFTLLPLAFVFEESRLIFVVLRDAPVIALAWWATAAVMWICHVVVRRRLRVSGL